MSGSGLSRVSPLSPMSARRRTVTTAAVAGGLLFALWFVPSAKATQEAPDQKGPGAPAQQHTDRSEQHAADDR